MPTDVALILTVFGRTYCRLCDEMLAALRELQGRFHFRVQVVDVDGDPALARLYGGKVPLLAHGSRELCHFRLDLEAVTAYLVNFR